MNIRKWFEFDPFEGKVKKSAGVIIILNQDKVLLCHPTNAKWFGTYSFPKGQLDSGETPIQAAIRELSEEVSININENQISNIKDPIIVEYDRSGKKYKMVYLYTVYINNLSEIGLESEVIPTEKLQVSEIDWAGFLKFTEADKRIFKRFHYLLDIL